MKRYVKASRFYDNHYIVVPALADHSPDRRADFSTESFIEAVNKVLYYFRRGYPYVYFGVNNPQVEESSILLKNKLNMYVESYVKEDIIDKVRHFQDL